MLLKNFFVTYYLYYYLVIHKGQAMSGYYRVINKSGGYTWMQTCATLICSNTSASANANKAANSNTNSSQSTSGTNTPSTATQEEQDQSVICVNYVLR